MFYIVNEAKVEIIIQNTLYREQKVGKDLFYNQKVKSALLVTYEYFFQIRFFRNGGSIQCLSTQNAQL